MAEVVKEGSTVQIDFTGKLEDGTVFDQSPEGQPLEFVIGEKKVLPALEEALKGMKKGGTKELKLEPKDAFGERIEDLTKEIPQDILPKEQEPKKGMMLMLQTPDGRKVPAMIADVDDKSVKIDLNHPLAGKTVIFEIKIAGIK